MKTSSLSLVRRFCCSKIVGCGRQSVPLRDRNLRPPRMQVGLEPTAHSGESRIVGLGLRPAIRHRAECTVGAPTCVPRPPHPTSRGQRDGGCKSAIADCAAERTSACGPFGVARALPRKASDLQSFELFNTAFRRGSSSRKPYGGILASAFFFPLLPSAYETVATGSGVPPNFPEFRRQSARNAFEPLLL